MAKRKRKRAGANQSALPVIHVTDERTLGLIVHWAKRFRDFDEVRFGTSQKGSPAVSLKAAGKVIAGVICVDEFWQRHAGNICESILIRREYEADAAA